MRLPLCVTAISPVGETVEAALSETAHLEQAVAEQGREMVVGTATEEGLSLWEADYGLPREAGAEARRARIREALMGGYPCTPRTLADLCVSVGGVERGEVRELFPNWEVELTAVTENALPGDDAALLRAVERRKPAHLRVHVLQCARVDAPGPLCGALWGECFVEVPAALAP